jgi:AraC family transcriptional regulator, transcriptional activator of pobA
MQDLSLITQLQHAFSKKVKDGVIDLDNKLINRDSFNLLRIEDLFAKTNGYIPAFRQSNFSIIFVKRGTGKRSIGSYTFTIEDNSLAVIPKRVIHASTYTSPPCGYFITFNPDFLLQQAFSYKLLNSKRVLKASIHSFMVLSQEQATEMTNIFEKIIEECHSGFEERRQMIALKLLELLVLCDRYLSAKSKQDLTFEYSNMLDKFDELIEQNFSRDHEVRFYADALHTHPNHLNYIIKKATGLTAKQTITQRIIAEAKYLLVSSTLSVKEIAYDLGFKDPNYFISFFKKDQHTTPVNFRSQFISFSKVSV